MFSLNKVELVYAILKFSFFSSDLDIFAWSHIYGISNNGI